MQIVARSECELTLLGEVWDAVSYATSGETSLRAHFARRSLGPSFMQVVARSECELTLLGEVWGSKRCLRM